MRFSFYMVCVWLFLIIGRPQDIFPGLKVIHPGDISAGLAILSFFLSRARQQTKPLSPELKLFLIFFLIAIMCTPFGYYPKDSIAHLWGFFGKTGILLFLFSNLVTDEKRAKTVVHTIMLSGFAMAFAALIEKAAQPGRVQVGSTYDPNDMAMVMVIALPIAIVEIMGKGSRMWKLFCLIGTMSCLLTTIATQSRGGLLGLSVIALMFFFMKGMPIPKGKIVFVLAALGAVFFLSLSSEYKERIKTIFEERMSDMSAGSGRMTIWRRSLIIARDNPLFGIGPNCFMTAYGDYLEKRKFPETLHQEGDWGGWQTAHNSFILILTELGVPGLIVYLTIIIRSFRNFNRSGKQRISDESSTNFAPLVTGLKISLSAFLVSAFFLSQAYNTIVFLYFVFSGEIVRIAYSEQHEEALRD